MLTQELCTLLTHQFCTPLPAKSEIPTLLVSEFADGHLTDPVPPLFPLHDIQAARVSSWRLLIVDYWNRFGMLRHPLVKPNCCVMLSPL